MRVRKISSNGRFSGFVLNCSKVEIGFMFVSFLKEMEIGIRLRFGRGRWGIWICCGIFWFWIIEWMKRK